MEFTWKITAILPTQTISNGSQIQECILEDDKQYPNSIKVQFYGDKIMMLNGKQVWDKVTAKLNFKTKQTQKWFFTSINCRDLRKIESVQDKMQQNSDKQFSKAEYKEVDILPF